MALTKQFSGNLYDKDGNALSDVLLKGYHKETNTWSTFYDTGVETQYNANLGDDQWLTQTGIANDNDTILLYFETKETDPLDRQFCLYEFTLTSESTYVQDVQLKPVQAPVIANRWDLSSPTDGTTQFENPNVAGEYLYIGRINESISTIADPTDEYTWNFGGVDLKQVITLYNQDIFSDRLGISSINFDWTEDGTYVADTSHIYTGVSPSDPGYNAVTIQVTNTKGLITTDTLKIQLRYNSPIPDITWDPINPSIRDTFILTGNITDVDGTITAISYKFDGNEVTNTTDINYSWQQSLGSLYQPTHNTNTDITWFDGFNSLDIIHQEIINMTNLVPEFDLLVEVVGDPANNQDRFTISNLLDPDGDTTLVEIKWVIEFKTPFDNIYKVVIDNGYPADIDQDPKEWIFEIGGDYRITAYAKDSNGGESSRSVDITFNENAQCTGAGSIKLNNNNWQLIAIPTDGKTVGDYFIPKVEAAIQAYDSTKTAADVIEVCSAYPGHINKFLSYIPGFTLNTSEHNFSLVIADGVDIKEVTGFWVKVKNYYTITGNEDITIAWDQKD